jgi:lysozyme
MQFTTTTSSLVALALSLAPSVLSQCVAPNVNTATLDLIKSFESFEPRPYLDQGGKPTIGYGHLCSSSSCSEIPYPIPLSESNGLALLQTDLKVARDCITLRTGSNVVLNANQYGAFVSWAFNAGCGNVQSSTLLRRLNAGESPNTVAAEELPKWNKVNGATSNGLVRRRAAEVSLARTASSAPALPACS